eukprot:CAMPEP_0194360222 /NCGR_PEP_ID=MMETSP0174-20130528/7519_1 /TAXON_ID=216777 /ORGANISM="Proboscia alata, Strain PI-D3" /LENGTH=192 /DNA_ID=CAMNT_0039131573 /DNA_START=137 /DNA_END=715 /DNA_ORIENTATION=-
MVVYVLYAKADLQGVASLKTIQGANLCVSVRNPVYQSEVREKVVIEADELIEQEKNDISMVHDKDIRCEPSHHFSLKWDGEKKRSTIRVIDSTLIEVISKSGKKGKNRNQGNAGASEVREMRSNDSGVFVPLLALDCQGIEPFAFHPMGGEFVVTNKAGDTFDQVDLSEGAWNEFELATGSTAITNFETKFS